MMGAYTRRDSDGSRAGPGAVLRLFPGAAGTRAPARRPAVRRRAADARDQPRADGAAEAVAAGRAVARPVAAAGARRSSSIIRRINQEQGVAILLVEQNAHIALKTADYGYVLEVGRIVLPDDCANLMQTRRHQGILSRPEGSRHPRPAALEEEAAVALIGPSPDAFRRWSPQRVADAWQRNRSCARRTAASGRR